MKQNKHTWQAVANLSLNTAYGTIREQSDVLLDCEIGIKPNGSGWFELYDAETGGEQWYGSGGLWFNGIYLVDYDGVFSLPSVIEEKLKELGYSFEKL